MCAAREHVGCAQLGRREWPECSLGELARDQVARVVALLEQPCRQALVVERDDQPVLPVAAGNVQDGRVGERRQVLSPASHEHAARATGEQRVAIERDLRRGAHGLRGIVCGHAVDRDAAAARKPFDRPSRAQPGERQVAVQADFRAAPLVERRSCSTSAGVSMRHSPTGRPPSPRPP